jgi:hypothetical protein
LNILRNIGIWLFLFASSALVWANEIDRMNDRLQDPRAFVSEVLEHLYQTGRVKIEYCDAGNSESIRQDLFAEVASEMEIAAFPLRGYRVIEKRKVKDLPELEKVNGFFSRVLDTEVGNVMLVVVPDIDLSGDHRDALFMPTNVRRGARQLKFNREMGRSRARVQAIVHIERQEEVYKRILLELFGHDEVVIVSSPVLSDEGSRLRQVVAHELGHLYYQNGWPHLFTEATFLKEEKRAEQLLEKALMGVKDFGPRACLELRFAFEPLAERLPLHIQLQYGIYSNEAANAEEFLKIYGRAKVDEVPQSVTDFFDGAYGHAREHSADDIFSAVHP